MKRLSARDRTLLGLLTVAVVSALGFLLFVLPSYTEAGRLVQSLKTQRTRLSEAEQLARRVPEKMKRITQLRAEIAAIARPNESPTPEVVRQIEAATKAQGVQLTYLHPAEPEFLENSTKYTTSFGAQASFDKLVRLLYDLEHNSHVLWVEGVELTADRDPGTLRAAITVSVYTRQAASRPGHAKS